MVNVIERGGKTMLGFIDGDKNVTALEIVWRNQNPVPPRRRRHSLEPTGDRALYILQEFVEDGQAGYWTRISDLEVVAGGRAA